MDIAFKFQTNGGFQLYKLLKSIVYNLPEADTSLPQSEFPCMKRKFTLSELRLQLGYVDLNQPEIQKESRQMYPDAEKLSKYEKKPKYRRWNDFYKRVIEPGVEEINRISDIYISGIEKECSAHGKVDGATIEIQRNRNYYAKKQGEKDVVNKELSEEQIDDFIDDIREIMKDSGLRTKDYKSIAEAAGYDMEKIRTQYNNSKKQDISNLVGWMITAVKDGYVYTESKKKDSKKATDKSKKKVHFKLEREYDFDKIEENLKKRNRAAQ